MNKFFKTLSFFFIIVLFTTACGGQVAQAAKSVPSAVDYQAVLGKSLNNQVVVDFIASNNCSAVSSFQLCKDKGMALWLDSEQTVQSVTLYPSSIDGFSAYQGELPLGLAANNTMATVEHKFGLPDESWTPDHFHYWATYRRFGVAIIYNSPSASDKGATIHAILVTK